MYRDVPQVTNDFCTSLDVKGMGEVWLEANRATPYVKARAECHGWLLYTSYCTEGCPCRA